MEKSELKKIYWFENISHSVVLVIGMLLAIYLYDHLDKVLALCGAILGTTVVLFIPSVCHFKLIACDRFEGSTLMKVFDLTISTYAVIVLILATSQVLFKW